MFVITDCAHNECELILYGKIRFTVLVILNDERRSSFRNHPQVKQAFRMECPLPMKADGIVRIDFHVHTNGSPEGIHGLTEVIARAKRVGLDGIAVTDHNRLMSSRTAARLSKIHDFLVIGGIEGGDLVRKKPHGNAHRHWIGLNLDETPSADDMQEITDIVREQGGLSIAPHPYARNGFKHYDTLGFDAVESLNGTRKDGEIDGKGLARVGGTDAHSKYMLGHTWTDVYDSNGSLESVLESVRKGNCAARGSRIPLWIIAAFYAAVLGRYLFNEPCELLQNGSRQLRRYF